MLDFDSVRAIFSSTPSRVISLVPSTTDSLLALGLISSVVGITDYCEVPEEIGPHLDRVGGTKNPDISKIVALNPDLIIANREENSKESIEELVAADLIVWLTFPTTVGDAIRDLWNLTRIFKIERTTATQLETLERVAEWTRLAESGRGSVSYFCPIWQSDDQERWMTFNHNTYANDILLHCGGVNVFSEWEWNYAQESDREGGDVRYPSVSIENIRQAEPQVVLLPSEPYHFGEEHIKMFRSSLGGIPAVENEAIYLLDGRLITWHGIKIADALVELPRYFR